MFSHGHRPLQLKEIIPEVSAEAVSAEAASVEVASVEAASAEAASAAEDNRKTKDARYSACELKNRAPYSFELFLDEDGNACVSGNCDFNSTIAGSNVDSA